MTKKPNPSPKIYFGIDVENAIVEYCNSNNRLLKEQIFNTQIYPALSKLAENRIFLSKITQNFPRYSYSDAKQDLTCFLYEKLSKFNPGMGKKAFSYFDRVSINWSYAKLRELAENTYGRTSIDQVDLTRDIDSEVLNLNAGEALEDFCFKWADWGNEYLDYFYFYKNGKIIPFDNTQKKVLNAIFDLFKNSKGIDIYKKKTLYILIREQVNVKTQIITDVVNVLKPLCQQMLREYHKNGTKYWHRYLYYPEEIEGEIDFEKEIE